MRILLVAVGTRMPSWVQTGYEEYAKRLPRDCRLELVEIPPAKRARTTPVERLRQAEENAYWPPYRRADVYWRWTNGVYRGRQGN